MQLREFLSNASDAEFVDIVSDLVRQGDANASVMCIVAYQNLTPMLAASAKLAAEGNATPKDLDEMITWCVKMEIKHEGEEVQLRRIRWFFIAALLMRSTKLAEDNRELELRIAQTWLHLTDGCWLMKAALFDQHNVLWSSQEKAYFDVVSDGKGGQKYCLNHVMPKWLRNTAAVEAYAEREDIGRTNPFLGGFFGRP